MSRLSVARLLVGVVDDGFEIHRELLGSGDTGSRDAMRAAASATSAGDATSAILT